VPCDTTPQQTSCGIDLHARTLSVCIRTPAGAMLVHQKMPASPDTWRSTRAPSRDASVVAGDGLGPGAGLAALWAPAGMPFGRGHALSRQASHGGTVPHAPLAAQHIAGRRRGGRRRRPWRRPRAARRPHGQHTHSPSNRPERGRKSADNTHRDGGAARLAAPAGHHSIDVALARLGHAAAGLRHVARSIRQAAKPHDANTRSRRRTVPGLGERLSLGRRSARHAIPRFPRG
jgi:hypothetical protein